MTPSSRQGTPDDETGPPALAGHTIASSPLPQAPTRGERRKYDLATLLNSPAATHARLQSAPASSTATPPGRLASWDNHDEHATLSMLGSGSEDVPDTPMFDEGALELFGSQDGWAALSMLGSTSDLGWWIVGS
jgi:hypothetical protein